MALRVGFCLGSVGYRVVAGLVVVVSLVLIVDRWNCFGYCWVLLVSLWLEWFRVVVVVVNDSFEFGCSWFVVGWLILVCCWLVVSGCGVLVLFLVIKEVSSMLKVDCCWLWVCGCWVFRRSGDCWSLSWFVRLFFALVWSFDCGVFLDSIWVS